MSDTKRHRDFWLLRQLSAAASHETWAQQVRPRYGLQTPGRGSAGWQFDKVHAKYGFKSMVFDKRRRVSTRKANENWTRVERRQLGQLSVARRRTLPSRLGLR